VGGFGAKRHKVRVVDGEADLRAEPADLSAEGFFGRRFSKGGLERSDIN
jgi:hypothetical protein